MKIAIYLSFAINYLAKARVTAETIKKQNPAVDVIALVADRFPAVIMAEDEPFDHIWMVDDYPSENISSWIYRHSIMELATAIKGWALVRLLEMGYDYVIYLDPDCYVLDDPAKIVDILPKQKSVAVVPHTTSPADTDEEIRIIETSSLRHGIFNLGFLLVKNDENGRRLANWWADRLDQYCVDDFKNGLFTDQRWFDLAVGYFDFIHITRHAGIDVASWNVGQRKLTRDGEKYTIDGDPLIFYHFSGVGPAGVHRWVREKFAPSDPLVAELEFDYERLIDQQGQSKLASVRPYYDHYTDGKLIEKEDRVLYRTRKDLQDKFPNPFDVSREPNFRTVARAERSVQLKSDVEPAPTQITHSAPPRDARRLFDPNVYSKSSKRDTTDLGELWHHYVSEAWTSQNRPNRYFDPVFYRRFVPDSDRIMFPTPLHHYLQRGLAAGLSPSWIYDEDYYLRRYPDVAAAIRAGHVTCGFEHFSLYGWKEGRSGCAFFNEAKYLAQNADVADALFAGNVTSGEQHFVDFGFIEGRSISGGHATDAERISGSP